ncbi:hypothetical protein [Colwellia psychrerythraea]|uniref:Uncharacterized protein n=1 Tax=Colwellia psychrerythraea TaxID=28229 RepID=A0A099KCB2_COLPS|nr:hypothetical protein [Colwellia psychrerythraea]KGJ87642.1 hypothetical protein ND2E_4380 [Colwellia psychrerythraea]
MNFSDYNEMSEEYLDDMHHDMTFEYIHIDREELRLMWGMCRDKYDKAIMMSNWHGVKEEGKKLAEYQVAFMNKCEQVVSSYMKSAPTWVDIILK